MLLRSWSIAGLLLIGSFIDHARADFRFDAAITSINGTAVTSGTYTDPADNVLTILPAYSSMGGINTLAQTSFVVSILPKDFHFGTDTVVSVFTITNMSTGHSLTLLARDVFNFAYSNFFDSNAVIPSSGTLTFAGNPVITGQILNLDGVDLEIVGGSLSVSGNSSFNQAKSVIVFSIVPEPSSLVLCGVAASIGLIGAQGRRRSRLAWSWDGPEVGLPPRTG